LAPSWLPRHLQLCVDADVGKELGAETFDLDANNNGTKRRVRFLKSYYQGVFVRIFRKNG
jgi:hypothetical protein